jgi:O6-methylguanine-DNA--protein-cysteine methyltransferase
MIEKIKHILDNIDISVITHNDQNLFIIILKKIPIREVENIEYDEDKKNIIIQTPEKEIYVDIEFILKDVLKEPDKRIDKFYLLDRKELQKGKRGIWLLLDIPYGKDKNDSIER